MWWFKKVFFLVLCFFLSFHFSFGGGAKIWWTICTDTWLPWCQTNISTDEWFFKFIWNIIAEWIQYTAVIAVIAVMISWMMYVASAGDEEKAKKAKKWILWSLIGVFLSVSAWGIINLLNSVSF